VTISKILLKGRQIVVNYERSIEDVVIGGALVFPFQGLSPDIGEPKNAAIIEVLRRIPEADFQRLDEKVDTFEWYLPTYEQLAEVRPFFCTHPEEPPEEGKLTMKSYARVLYLSPLLVDVAKDVAVAVVAHELAHILLDHELINSSRETYDHQEDEAWNLARQWGFAKEIEARDRYRSQCEQ
jgi:hypothetical protein